ncbi:hypothetical protein F5B21DRAFT_474339 [Xylaria acuta]|nr:hypothetical protein F5B21DRAFT_474339 [Xylaria acuta]
MESPPIIKGTLDQDIPVEIPDREPLNESSDSANLGLDSESPKDLYGEQTLRQSQFRAPKSRKSRPPSSIPCPAIGASHSHLLAFGIHICPRCHSHIHRGDKEEMHTSKKDSSRTDYATQSQPLKPELDGESEILTQLHEIKKDVSSFYRKWKDEYSDRESESEKEDVQLIVSGDDERDDCDFPGGKRDAADTLQDMEEEGGDAESTAGDKSDVIRIGQEVGITDREMGVLHEIEFQDAGEYFLHRRPWKGPFDLIEARKGVEDLARKTIAEITTILVTNIQRDDSRSEKERTRIQKAGFLRNPRIEFKHVKQEIAVRSKQLIEVLRSMVYYYPSINLQAEFLIFDSPFCVLAHHLVELENFKNNLKANNGLAMANKDAVGPPTPHSRVVATTKSSRITINHIEKLLHFMKHNLFSDQIEAEKARYLQDPPVCTFTMMWLLYKPGTTAYVKDAAGKVSAYIMQKIEVDSTVSALLERSRPYTVTLWNLGFDGTYVCRSNKVMTIGAFDGERPIMDLKIVPAAFVDASDEGKTRKALIERGRKWFKMLTGAQQWHYLGPTASLGKGMIDTRVVIDIGYFVKSQGGRLDAMGSFIVQDMGGDLAICACEKCLGRRPHPPKGFPWAEYDLIDPKHADLELSDGHKDKEHRYLLCSGLLMGFALKSRTWEPLDVEHCQPARINANAINTLVMPDERKRMIKAIVQKYTDPMFTPGRSTSTWGADFIETKGEGQIFLLHGGPGVGKTYTAECISELIGRPLLSLTCADFGTDEEAMEGRLSSWFKLAESWGAVMVLDEADVWLERRMIADLKRNTLVAVFLRCLEYYRGILFLTSNRVGTFDDAFISRIHLVIYYEDLGEPQRKQIWTQFFDKLERERRDDIIVESRAKHFVLNDSEMRKIPWNGREIRNVFQTAVSLAEYRFQYEGGKMESDKIVLDKVDFEQVCQMSVEFKEYLIKVHKGDDENDRAMRDRARA